MRMRQFWIVPALLAMLAWGCDSSSSDTTAGTDTAASSDTAAGEKDGEVGGEPGELTLDFAAGDPVAGETVFATCAACHGADGKGQSTGSPATSGADLTEEVKDLGDANFAFVIKNGWKDMGAQKQLSDQQIVDVIAYIRQTYGQ